MFDNLIRKFLEHEGKGKFTTKEKIFFFKELSYLVEGGIVITDAIKLIQENTNNNSIKSICENIYESLNKGEAFSRAISRLPKYFNDGDVNIIRSGEGSGELVKVLKYLANEYEFIYDIRNKYVGAMVYPGLIFSVSLIAIYIVFTVILPGILEIVDDFDGIDMPFTTQLLMDITNFFINYNLLILISLFLSILAFSIFLGLNEGKRWFDKNIFKIPFFGGLTKYYYLIKFLRYKKLLISAGMNYVEIFAALRKIFNNSQYTDMIEEVLDSLNKGEDMLKPMNGYKNIIPADVIVLLKSGQESANLDNAIQNAIWLYQEEFNQRLGNLSKVIEPILVVLVGGIVAFIALSVFGVIGAVLDSASF